MMTRIARQLPETAALSLAFFLANFRASIFSSLFPDTSRFDGAAWMETAFWLLPICLLVWILARDRLLGAYLAEWRKNGLLLAFVAFAFFSMAWSVSLLNSLYRWLGLAFSSLIAAYIGLRYNVRGLLVVLFWFGAIFLILNFSFGILVPRVTIMTWPPYNGAWRGLFWHRNHLGSIAALFNALFLVRLIAQYQARRREFIIDGILYLLSLLLVHLASSATGYILVVLIHFATGLALLWLRFADRLRPVHYYLAFGVLMLGAIMALTNLGTLLSLLNRDTTLTGRTGLWKYLLESVVRQSPWFGYGFGAIWTFEWFRVGTQHLLGWGYPIVIGDNGFLDILLHVGIIGLALFVGVFSTAWVRSLQHMLADRTLEGFFPALFMFYATLANMSYSLFLESESFIWLLLVAILFMTRRDPERQ